MFGETLELDEEPSKVRTKSDLEEKGDHVIGFELEVK